VSAANNPSRRAIFYIDLIPFSFCYSFVYRSKGVFLPSAMVFVTGFVPRSQVRNRYVFVGGAEAGQVIVDE
jgi:hypothetical protein